MHKKETISTSRDHCFLSNLNNYSILQSGWEGILGNRNNDNIIEQTNENETKSKQMSDEADTRILESSHNESHESSHEEVLESSHKRILNDDEFIEFMDEDIASEEGASSGDPLSDIDFILSKHEIPADGVTHEAPADLNSSLHHQRYHDNDSGSLNNENRFSSFRDSLGVGNSPLHLQALNETEEKLLTILKSGKQIKNITK